MFKTIERGNLEGHRITYRDLELDGYEGGLVNIDSSSGPVCRGENKKNALSMAMEYIVGGGSPLELTWTATEVDSARPRENGVMGEGVIELRSRFFKRNG